LFGRSFSQAAAEIPQNLRAVKSRDLGNLPAKNSCLWQGGNLPVNNSAVKNKQFFYPTLMMVLGYHVMVQNHHMTSSSSKFYVNIWYYGKGDYKICILDSTYLVLEIK
jgi:hypothetical protein